MITTAAPPLNSARAKELLSYKQVPKNERKAGIKFWLGRRSRTLFWCDLVEVDYDPDATEVTAAGTDEELSAPVESITLYFHQYVVTIKGYRLWHIDQDCQNHLTDFVRISPVDAIMSGATGTREEPPVIKSIKIEKPEKKGR